MARRRRRAGVVPVLPVASTTAPPTGAVARPDLPEIARVIRNPSDKAVLAVTFVASRVENEIFLSVRNKEPFEFVRAGFNWSLKFNCDTTSQLHLRCDRQNDLHCNQWKLDYDVLVCCSSQVNPNHKCPDFTKSGTCTAADAPEISIPINDEFWKTLVEMPPEGQGFVKTAVLAEVHFTCKQMSGFRSLSNFSYDFSQASRNSDAVFKFGKESVFVNCNLLSHHSEYFSATQNRLSDVNMTRDSNGLPIVEVEGVDPTEFTELMQIVYPSKHEITDTNIDYILELADRFRFETVLKDCEKFLLSGESGFDVTTMLYWSSRYTMRELQQTMARRRRRAGVVPVLPVASTTAPPTGAVARPDLPEIARVIRNPSDKAVLAVTFVASRVENEIFLSVRNKEPFEFVRAGFNWSLKFNCDTTSQLHLRCDRQNDLHCNQWKLDYDVLVCCSSQVNPNHKCPDFTKSGTCTAADAPEISIPINDEFWKTLVEMPPEGQGFVKTAVLAEVHFTCKQMSGFRSLSNFSYDFSQASRNSDAVFKFGKESVFVNCNLLSHHSEYFSATQNRLSDVNMTRDSNGLPIVEVEGVDPTEFTELMQIVYPSKHEITDTNIDYILELADRFRFETVLKDCEKFLLSGESGFDVTTMLYWSSRYTMRELQEWCFSQFISPEDFDELFVSDIYRNSQLPLDVVMVLLRKSRDLSD